MFMSLLAKAGEIWRKPPARVFMRCTYGCAGYGYNNGGGVIINNNNSALLSACCSALYDPAIAGPEMQ